MHDPYCKGADLSTPNFLIPSAYASLRPHGMKHSNQILCGDQTRQVENFYMLVRAINPGQKFFGHKCWSAICDS